MVLTLESCKSMAARTASVGASLISSDASSGMDAFFEAGMAEKVERNTDYPIHRDPFYQNDDKGDKGSIEGQALRGTVGSVFVRCFFFRHPNSASRSQPWTTSRRRILKTQGDGVALAAVLDQRPSPKSREPRFWSSDLVALVVSF